MATEDLLAVLTRAERIAAFMARDYEPENGPALLSDLSDVEILALFWERFRREPTEPLAF